jgi:hypothetical protein
LHSAATLDEILEVLGGDGLEKMQQFWVAEHATMGLQLGHCGGGLQFFTAQTFQNPIRIAYDTRKIPDFPEALWHFDMMVLINSLNDKQGKRLGRLNESVMSRIQQQSEAFLKKLTSPHTKNNLGFMGRLANNHCGITYQSPQ